MEMTRKFNNRKGMEIWTKPARLAFGVRIPVWNSAFIESMESPGLPGPLSGHLSGLAICRIAKSKVGSDALNRHCDLRAVIKRVCEICGWVKLAFNTIFLRGLKC